MKGKPVFYNFKSFCPSDPQFPLIFKFSVVDMFEGIFALKHSTHVDGGRATVSSMHCADTGRDREDSH